MSRVVVTGLGLVTSLGNDLTSTWEGLCQGKSGVGEITAYDTSQYRVHFGAQVKTFDPALYMERKEVRRNDPMSSLPLRRQNKHWRTLNCRSTRVMPKISAFMSVAASVVSLHYMISLRFCMK